MYKRILASLLLIACLWLTQSMFSTLHSSATPEVKSLSQTTFARLDDGPDPNEIFKLANQARQAEGLKALNANPQLTTVAEARATDMAKNHYYAHKDQSGHFYY